MEGGVNEEKTAEQNEGKEKSEEDSKPIELDENKKFFHGNEVSITEEISKLIKPKNSRPCRNYQSLQGRKIVREIELEDFSPVFQLTAKIFCVTVLPHDDHKRKYFACP